MYNMKIKYTNAKPEEQWPFQIHTLTHISYIQGSVENIDNEKLASLCITEGVRYSEDTLETRYEDLKIPSSEDWNKVFENIQYQYMSVFKARLELVDHWAHIHKKYESTNMHHHVNIDYLSNDPDISGVYYVQIPKNAGKLVFRYNINQYKTRTYWVEPVVGNFFIFPSSLLHYVTKNLADDLRISISFNARALV